MIKDLRGEFLSPPEGTVGPRSLVIRPSLWAGLEAVAHLLAQLAPVLLSFLIPYVVFGVVERDATPFLFLENLDLGFGLLLALGPAVRVAFTRYTLDDEGIRVRSTFLSKSDQHVAWEKITALRHRRTVLGWLVGIETLEVVAYGKKGTSLRLVGLRDAALLRDQVARRMRSTASVAALFRND
jgi:uncharacterized membrane protein YdbT with pleckstrin-like domain